MSDSLRQDRPWAFLTRDMLIDVSGRLHDAADYIRFHAVCTSWRDLPHSPATRPRLLPWLLTQCKGRAMSSRVIYSGRTDSPSESEGTSSYHRSSFDNVVPVATVPSADGGERNWVASADGTTAWFFTRSPEPRLVNLVTGTVKPLPHFPNHDVDERRMRNPHGMVYGDDTVFLYTFDNVPQHGYHFYTAAILRPGDAAWTVIHKRQNMWAGRDACAAYHDGKVLVWADKYSWCVMTPDFQANGNHDDTVTSGLKTLWHKVDNRYVLYRCYVLESHGDLLRASVLVKTDWFYGRDNCNDPSPTVSVTVHALEEGAGNEVRWVVRDGSGLADRVLYLGLQASFSADAAQLGIPGGYAYFVFEGREVFRCSLVVNGKAKFIKQLRPGLGAKWTHVWFEPQPAIAPTQKIQERLENQSKQKV